MFYHVMSYVENEVIEFAVDSNRGIPGLSFWKKIITCPLIHFLFHLIPPRLWHNAHLDHRSYLQMNFEQRNGFR